MTVHHLKTWTEPFEAIQLGRKGFEYRAEDDRRFEEGDLLCLEHWDEELERHTGNALWRVVTFVLRDAFGVPPGFAVLSLAPMSGAGWLGIEVDLADIRDHFESRRFVEALRS